MEGKKQSTRSWRMEMSVSVGRDEIVRFWTGTSDVRNQSEYSC